MIATDLESFYGSRYDESLRLTSSVKGQLELARVRELVTRHMPVAAARVADIGGATGVHAAWLRADGYEVDLIDPIPRDIETAQSAGPRARLGDARDLPWEENEFDAALMAGPLYHLTDADDRRVALHEAARVVRPGGLVAAVAFNRTTDRVTVVPRKLYVVIVRASWSVRLSGASILRAAYTEVLTRSHLRRHTCWSSTDRCPGRGP